MRIKYDITNLVSSSCLHRMIN